MASNVTHQLTVAIGAALSGSFSSVMADSTSKISKIGTAIKDMEKQSVLSVGTINRLKSRYDSFLGSMDKQQAIVQKRAFYRSQIMDIVALGAALAAPIKMAKEFNSHLSKFKRMYDFKESDGHRKLGDVLTGISLQVPVTIDNIGKLATAGARFGVTLEDLPNYVTNVAKASRVWGMEADELGEKMGNFMKVFNVGAKDVPKYFDVITKMGRTSGKTSDDVLKSMIRAADGLANFKLSVPQIAALTTTIMSFGEGSEQAGTLVSGMLQKLSIAGWEATKTFFETIWSSAQIHWLKFKTILDEYGVTDKIIAGWNLVKSLFESIWSFAEPHWNNFKLVLQEYAVVDKIMAAWTTVRDFFSVVWNAVTPHWDGFIAKIQELNIADKIMASWQKLKTFFTGIWNDVIPKWDTFTAPLSKIWDSAKSSVSSVGSLFSANENRPSIASKMPPLSGAKAAPVTKNQNVSVAVNVNASKISDPREVAKQVSKEMKGFNWNYLFDPVGALP
jgi:hypothetical protein